MSMNQKVNTTNHDNDITDSHIDREHISEEKERWIVIRFADGEEIVLAKPDAIESTQKKRNMLWVVVIGHVDMWTTIVTQIAHTLAHHDGVHVVSLSQEDLDHKIAKGSKVLLVDGGVWNTIPGSLESMAQDHAHMIIKDIERFHGEVNTIQNLLADELRWKKEQEKRRRKHANKKKLYRRK